MFGWRHIDTIGSAHLLSSLHQKGWLSCWMLRWFRWLQCQPYPSRSYFWRFVWTSFNCKLQNNQYSIWVWYVPKYFCIFTDRNNALPVNLELILGIILPVLIMALCITLAYFLFIHKKGISMCRVHKSVLLESSPTPSSYPPSSRSFGSESKFKKGARSDCDYPLLGVISGNGGPPSSSGPGPYTLDESLSSQRTIKELVEETTGSGSGLPILIQRTIARQINLEKEIGRGR